MQILQTLRFDLAVRIVAGIEWVLGFCGKRCSEAWRGLCAFFSCAFVRVVGVRALRN